MAFYKARAALYVLLAAVALPGCADGTDGGGEVKRSAGAGAFALVKGAVASLQFGASAADVAKVDSGCADAVCAVKRLVAQAHARGAKLIVAPEYGLDQKYLEPDPQIGEVPATDSRWPASTAIKIFSAQARSLGVYLVINLQTSSGSGSTRRRYNTQVAFDPQGKVVGKHHKFELFAGEAKSLTAGDDVMVFDTPLGKVGLLICADMYGDLRLHDKLTRVLGARIVAVSSLWTAAGGPRWPASFAKNWGVYVVASNTTEGAGRGGGVFAPDGRALAVSTPGEVGLTVATLPATP